MLALIVPKNLLPRLRMTDAVGLNTFLIVLAGDKQVDVSALNKHFVGIKSCNFANQVDIESLTNGYKPGFVPPFSFSYDLSLILGQDFVDRNCNGDIFFGAGKLEESVSMKLMDYLAMTRPSILKISK